MKSMTRGNAINYKSKKKEFVILLNNLQVLGLDVTPYCEAFKSIWVNCDKELEKLREKGKGFSTDSNLDLIYAKYLKQLRDLMANLNVYRKLLRAYENSHAYKEAAEKGMLTEENITICVNDAIREIARLVTICDFKDPNCEIMLQKILSAYTILMKKELFFNGHSILIDYIERMGLAEIFISLLDNNEIKVASLEEYLVSDSMFSQDVLNKLQTQYNAIEEKIGRREEVEKVLHEKNIAKEKTMDRKKQANISRLVASATALVVLTSGLIYGANKGLKALATNRLYHTTKTTCSTIDTTEKTTSSYIEKIKNGEKILVVSYTPWEEYLEDNYTRTVVSADVTSIDYPKLENYLDINLANLSSVDVETETATNLTDAEIYERQITEVIRLIQNPGDAILDTDNFIYKFSLQIILFSLLTVYVIIKGSFLFAGITEGVLSSILENIYNNLKTRKDCDKILAELDTDIAKLIAEYNTNDKNIDILMEKFRFIYDKYRFLIQDSTILEKYDSLVRKRRLID